jgi:hypothetical protein
MKNLQRPSTTLRLVGAAFCVLCAAVVTSAQVWTQRENVTNDVQTKAAIVPNTAPSPGQLLTGNAGGTAYAPVLLSQDCTLTSAGVLTCLKTNNVVFSSLATTVPGTGVATALGVNVGSAGASVVNGGALGTPSSGTVTNLTGTASININGTVGATTPGTGAFTTLAAGSNTFNISSSGLPTKSNNLTLAGQGYPLILGLTSQKTETASADTNVLTTTPASAVGTYKVCVAISVASATSGVISWTLSWTDSNGNAQSNVAQQIFQMGTAAPNTTFTTSSAGNYHGCSMIDVNSAGANIIVKWVGGGTSSAKVSAFVQRIN